MIYYITDGKNVKVGFTEKDVNKRLRQLQTGSSSKLYLIAFHDGDLNKEKEVHNRFIKDRIRMNNEWFYVEEDGALHKYLNEISRLYVDVDNGKINLYMKMNKI